MSTVVTDTQKKNRGRLAAIGGALATAGLAGLAIANRRRIGAFLSRAPKVIQTAGREAEGFATKESHVAIPKKTLQPLPDSGIISKLKQTITSQHTPRVISRPRAKKVYGASAPTPFQARGNKAVVKLVRPPNYKTPKEGEIQTPVEFNRPKKHKSYAYRGTTGGTPSGMIYSGRNNWNATSGAKVPNSALENTPPLRHKAESIHGTIIPAKQYRATGSAISGAKSPGKATYTVAHPSPQGSTGVVSPGGFTKPSTRHHYISTPKETRRTYERGQHIGKARVKQANVLQLKTGKDVPHYTLTRSNKAPKTQSKLGSGGITAHIPSMHVPGMTTKQTGFEAAIHTQGPAKAQPHLAIEFKNKQIPTGNVYPKYVKEGGKAEYTVKHRGRKALPTPNPSLRKGKKTPSQLYTVKAPKTGQQFTHTVNAKHVGFMPIATKGTLPKGKKGTQANFIKSAVAQTPVHAAPVYEVKYHPKAKPVFVSQAADGSVGNVTKQYNQHRQTMDNLHGKSLGITSHEKISVSKRKSDHSGLKIFSDMFGGVIAFAQDYADALASDTPSAYTPSYAGSVPPKKKKNPWLKTAATVAGAGVAGVIAHKYGGKVISKAAGLLERAPKEKIPSVQGKLPEEVSKVTTAVKKTAAPQAPATPPAPKPKVYDDAVKHYEQKYAGREAEAKKLATSPVPAKKPLSVLQNAAEKNAAEMVGENAKARMQRRRMKHSAKYSSHASNQDTYGNTFNANKGPDMRIAAQEYYLRVINFGEFLSAA